MQEDPCRKSHSKEIGGNTEIGTHRCDREVTSAKIPSGSMETSFPCKDLYTITSNNFQCLGTGCLKIQLLSCNDVARQPVPLVYSTGRRIPCMSKNWALVGVAQVRILGERGRTCGKSPMAVGTTERMA